MNESYDLKDLNLLFSSKIAMHDEVMTHIDIIENKIWIEYGNIGEMTLHFDISKGREFRNVELSFTPTSINFSLEE